MPPSSNKSSLSFGVFQISLSARELRKHGIRIRLGGQPFTILEMLLEKPGEIVTREELQARIWPADTFVDFEQGLNGAIKKLRDALSDSPENPRYVETLPRIGYRFIAPVSGNGHQPTPIPATAEPQPAQKAAVVPSRGSSVSMRLVIGVIGVAVLAAAAAFYFHFRSNPPLLTNKDTIVVADFENSTKEPVFDDALHQGLIVGMEQSPFFQVLSDRKSAVILKQMGRPSDERISGGTAIELCERAGSKVAVQGSIAPLGTDYRIALIAYRCDNAEAIAHEQVEANSKEEVLSALNEVTKHLRTRLGESIASIEKYNAPIEQATTPSLEALKAYSLALAKSDRDGDRVAIPFFKRAIELDPNFAMAYGQLAAVYQNLGEAQLARENAIQGFAHKDRTTESERLLIESWYNIYASGDLEKAASLLEIWTRNYPPEPRVLNDLGAAYGNLGRYEKAVENLQASVRLDPTDATPYANLAASLMALNRMDEAGSVLAQAEKEKLQTDYLLGAEYWRAFLLKDSKEMDRVISLAEDVPGARSNLLPEQANTEAYFGRFAKARQLSEAAASAMTSDGDTESAAVALAVAALRDAEVGENGHAHTYMTRALRLTRSADVLALAAMASVQLGDFAQTRSLADELDKAHPTDTLIQKYWLPAIRARLELRQGKSQKALELLEATVPFEFAVAPGLSVSVLYPDFVRGEAYLAAGDGFHAAQEFQKVIDHPGMTVNIPLRPLAYLGLARAQLRSSDSSKADEIYAKFFELWKEADANLTLLKQARSELRSRN
jgi:DNA-binding winged helix-turn-helix (wHTH) protein/Flp pilus assembly protein TadD